MRPIFEKSQCFSEPVHMPKTKPKQDSSMANSISDNELEKGDLLMHVPREI